MVLLTGFPPLVAGFQVGISATTRKTSSSQPPPIPETISTEVTFPSASTVNLYSTVPWMFLFRASTGYLMLFPRSKMRASSPPGYWAGTRVVSSEIAVDPSPTGKTVTSGSDRLSDSAADWNSSPDTTSDEFAFWGCTIDEKTATDAMSTIPVTMAVKLSLPGFKWFSIIIRFFRWALKGLVIGLLPGIPA